MCENPNPLGEKGRSIVIGYQLSVIEDLGPARGKEAAENYFTYWKKIPNTYWARFSAQGEPWIR
jgi:hypothetical protein